MSHFVATLAPAAHRLRLRLLLALLLLPLVAPAGCIHLNSVRIDVDTQPMDQDMARQRFVAMLTESITANDFRWRFEGAKHIEDSQTYAFYFRLDDYDGWTLSDEYDYLAVIQFPASDKPFIRAVESELGARDYTYKGVVVPATTVHFGVVIDANVTDTDLEWTVHRRGSTRITQSLTADFEDWEWTDGRSRRSGLQVVDFASCKRCMTEAWMSEFINVMCSAFDEFKVHCE